MGWPRQPLRASGGSLTIMGVGLGELELDHSVLPDDWYPQEQQLRLVLRSVQPDHVVVIHCRSMRKDATGSVVYMRCLRIPKKCVLPKQPVNVHFFSGTAETAGTCFSYFPYAMFVFTGVAGDSNPKQVEGLQAVPLNRLLLETDSLCFQTRGFEVSARTRYLL